MIKKMPFLIYIQIFNNNKSFIIEKIVIFEKK